MRRIVCIGPVLLSGLVLLAGCTDEIPTLSDAGRFPEGTLPATIQHTFQTAEIIRSASVVNGIVKPADVTYKLIARDFDNSLNAHLLAQFNSFPGEVVLDTGVDSALTYLESFAIATLPDTLRVSSPQLDFSLWTVTQPFDSIDVSWQNAVDRPSGSVPWTTPGGTRGELIATVRWFQSDTVPSADSLKWILPPAVVTGLADGTLPGLMVTMESPNSRAEISSLTIDARVRPESRDTILSQIVESLAQTFIYNPEPPEPENVLRVGGIRSDRALLRLDISNALPRCMPDGAVCDGISAADVTLNRVDLLLDPVPVEGGFRPIVPLEVTIRRILEPELGDRAPLGPVMATDSIPIANFLVPTFSPVTFFVTGAVNQALARGDTELALALVVEPEGRTPSYAWFSRNPRLRFVYTLRQQPQLP